MAKKTKSPARKAKENFEDISRKAERLESLIKLSNNLRDQERREPVPFNDFLHTASLNPECVFRDIFQLFHDMIHHYVPDTKDDFPASDNSIGFHPYDCTELLVNDCDEPFFADRLFANRLIDLANRFRKGTQKHNILLFEGPPGSGKSTFLNNLLQKLEDYAKTPEGTTFKVFWNLDLEKLGGYRKLPHRVLDFSEEIGLPAGDGQTNATMGNGGSYPGKFLRFSCPNHDHPIFMIPKTYRKQFLEELIPDKEFKKRLFSERQYQWVLKYIPCKICNSLYKAILDTTGNPLDVYNMMSVRKNFFSRQFGEGLSVFNPGDLEIRNPIGNPMLQSLLNSLFENDDIRFRYSYLAKTNNGVLALMDIKENNVTRLKNFHGIISDGVHKVELAEERINTLFLGLINPADRKHYEDIPSFQDRIITIQIPYVLDYKAEMNICRNKLGAKAEALFLPHVLKNFARTIISSRLENSSPAIKKWITNQMWYRKFVDENMLLLKMDIYTGKIPSWLTEDDLKRFTKDIRIEIIAEAKTEGSKGFSGRQSIIILNQFLSDYVNENLITMEMLKNFFEKNPQLNKQLPVGFLKSLIDLYDYSVLQEVKEAIYYYNEEQLRQEILDYLYAINFEPGVSRKSAYTGNEIEITEEYFQAVEAVLTGSGTTPIQRRVFRKDIQVEYVSKTLAQEIQLQNKGITETDLYNSLFEKYTRNLKEHALAPYLDNDNFRRAIQDYGTANFNAYSGRLRRDVNLLIDNMQAKFGYTKGGARLISLYVVDKKLVSKF